MSSRSILLAAVAALAAVPAFAEIRVENPYFRTSGAMARSGAAFMEIVNDGEDDDRLVGASSDLGDRVELHTHIDQGGGVMSMQEVEDGFPIPAGAGHALARGGDHVMFMGLTRKVADGDMVTLTLTFEKAGDVTVDVPVDMTREPGMGGGHGNMNHGN